MRLPGALRTTVPEARPHGISSASKVQPGADAPTHTSGVDLAHHRALLLVGLRGPGLRRPLGIGGMSGACLTALDAPWLRARAARGGSGGRAVTQRARLKGRFKNREDSLV